jgi:ABC-type branched-subunit amino acid transport system substrate-binding protein
VGGRATLNVYVSLPLHGERAAEGRAAAGGARLALARSGGMIGSFRVRARYLDDTGGGPRWDPVASAANARLAAQDSTAIGFLGDIDSGATRVSLPITNEAEIPQISPGAIAPDLTGERYRPSDRQTFARIVPSASVLERAAARLARRIGVPGRRVSVGAPSPAALRGCRAGAPLRYLISPYREPSRSGPRGRAFDRSYRRRFGRQPRPAAAYGFEAMSLLLSAIRRAGGEGGDRGSVSGLVLATRGRNSVIGEYSIRSSGDTTLETVTAYSIRGCRLASSAEISGRPG